MSHVWGTMGDFYNKIVKYVSENTTSTNFQLNKNTTVFSQILFAVSSRKMYSYQAPDQIGKFPQTLNGLKTNYRPGFKDM